MRMRKRWLRKFYRQPIQIYVGVAHNASLQKLLVNTALVVSVFQEKLATMIQLATLVVVALALSSQPVSCTEKGYLNNYDIFINAPGLY